MAEIERKIFAKNLRFFIEKSHLNQTQIADRLNVSKGTVSDYVHGRAFPRPEKLAELCNILGVSQFDLTTDFYSDKDTFVPDPEALRIAQELQNDPELRRLYSSIRRLSSEDRAIIRNLISKITE